MAKLKNIIKQLSEKDYEAIYHSLIESSADKSAYLLMSLREKNQSDIKIMDELEVNTNAYYTLRSRLNQKIEEYLLQQMESPRTDILKKVANINEIIFTKKPAIVIATLKKLEKELLDYDLANELTIIYKLLKKLNLNSPDYFNYSQLYNRHVAYMLALDKAEDILAEYFKKFGNYFLSGEETNKLELSLLLQEMQNVSALYESHRLYVFLSSMTIFHRLFVEKEEEVGADIEPIEDILAEIQRIFDTYPMDSIYYHLNLVFEFLKHEYYNYYKVYSKAEKYFEEINDAIGNLLTNYSLYSYPAQFLVTKLRRSIRLNQEEKLHQENEVLFIDYESDIQDVPKHITYVVYRALSCYYAGLYEEASRWINELLNTVSLKNYPLISMEIKSILALQYCLTHDYELFNQLINSIQRQIRLLGKENCEHILHFTKALKISVSENKRQKEEKISNLFGKVKLLEVNYFSPTKLINTDDRLIKMLSRYE
jgi:effector-binding domain-containing protein